MKIFNLLLIYFSFTCFNLVYPLAPEGNFLEKDPLKELERLSQIATDFYDQPGQLQIIKKEKEYWQEKARHFNERSDAAGTFKIRVMVNPLGNHRFYFDRLGGKILFDGKPVSPQSIKIDVNELISQFTSSKEAIGKEVVSLLLYGDLYFSENHWIYTQGRLYTNAREMKMTSNGLYYSEKSYPGIAVMETGEMVYHNEMKLTGFEGVQEEINQVPVFSFMGGSLMVKNPSTGVFQPLKGVETAFFIKPTVESGTPLRNEQLGEYGDDMNWYFSLPLFERLPGKGFKNLYFGTEELMKDRAKRKKALNGETIELSLNEVLSSVFDLQLTDMEKEIRIRKIFARWGYIPVNSSERITNRGDYFLNLKKMKVTLRLLEGINPLSMLGVDNQGNVHLTEIQGLSRFAGMTVADSARYFSQKVSFGGIIAEGTDIGKNTSASAVILIVKDKAPAKEKDSTDFSA